MKKKKLSQQARGVWTIYLLLVLVFIVMCICSESFRSLYNITNMLTQCVPLACVAMGQTLVIISGGIDLSVGLQHRRVYGGGRQADEYSSPVQIALGAAAVILTGVLVGALNGLGVNLLKVPPLITTLCMNTVLSGVALWILPMAGGKVNRDFCKFVYQKWTILSMPLLIMLALLAVMSVILYRTRTGVHIYAIGKNRRRIAASQWALTPGPSASEPMCCAACAPA